MNRKGRKDRKDIGNNFFFAVLAVFAVSARQ